MSNFSAHKALEEAQEREEHARGNRAIAIPAAIFAVLAALATLLAHGRSTTALVDKDEAILAQSKASDTYSYYESKRIKYHLYQALTTAGLGAGPAHQQLVAVANKEAGAAKPILARAQALERDALDYEQHSESALRAFELLEFSVTLLEVSIIFVSISALARSRALLLVAGTIAAAGFVFLVLGVLHHL